MSWLAGLVLLAAASQVEAVPAARQANLVAVLPVHGEIDRVTQRSLERRLQEATRRGAGAVVIELDTPGGEMLATLEICHLLRTAAPANTVAWINPKAFSAGTIIALACRDTVVHPESVFGDAAPIQGLPIVGLLQLPVAERAKLEAPLLSEVVDSARRRGIDEKLVQSFIAVTMELWLIEEIRTGARMFVDAGEYEIAFGEPPPRLRQRGAPREVVAPAAPVEEPGAAPDAFLEDPADSTASMRRMLTPADRGQWRLIGQVIGSEELLTVRADEAIAYGLASTKIADDESLRAYFGATEVVRLDETWSEMLVRFLVSWPVRLVLIAVLLVGFFVEIASPGFGVFGTAAALALVALIGAPALAGLAQWWEVALVLVGLALVAIELFVLPGFGVAGVAGILCLFVGLVGTFVDGSIGSGEWQQQIVTGLATTLAAAFAAGVGLWMLSRHFGAIRGLDRLVLRGAIDGTITASARVEPTREDLPPAGAMGVAVSQLRPSGRVEFEGRTFDARSDGSFVEPGTPVRSRGERDGTLEVEPWT